MCLIIFHDGKRNAEKQVLHFVPAEIAAAAAAHLKHLTQHLCNPMLSFWKHNFLFLILFIKLSNILAEKINAASVKQVPLLCFHCNNTELD